MMKLHIGTDTFDVSDLQHEAAGYGFLADQKIAEDIKAALSDPKGVLFKTDHFTMGNEETLYRFDREEQEANGLRIRLIEA